MVAEYIIICMQNTGQNANDIFHLIDEDRESTISKDEMRKFFRTKVTHINRNKQANNTND